VHGVVESGGSSSYKVCLHVSQKGLLVLKMPARLLGAVVTVRTELCTRRGCDHGFSKSLGILRFMYGM
jgi:hypothetical protein